MDGELGLRKTRGQADAGHFELPGGYALLGPRYMGGHTARLRMIEPNILTDGREEYPVVDGIPYLILESTRPGLGDLRARACAALRKGDEGAALRLLLRDQDRFSPTAPPSAAAVDELLARRGELTLRKAMQLLNYGAVGDYFAYRWSSPTFQSGLALLECGALPARPLLEVACGIGHFLRHMEVQRHSTVGIDIVFSKLWLARRFMEVEGLLICGDIERSPTLSPGRRQERGGVPHTVFCHDAFYFFEHKREAWRHMREASNRGTVICGHVHTRGDQHEAGFAERLDDYRALLPVDVKPLDDLAQARTYVSRENHRHGATEHSTALAWSAGRTLQYQRDLRPARSRLRINPLLTADGGLAWPSDGWRREFRADSEALGGEGLEAFAKTPYVRTLVASGRPALESLTEAELVQCYRHRALVDLPRRW